MAQTLAAAVPAQIDADDAAITRTILDYMEGWYDGDAVRMERSLHPNLAKRIVRYGDPPSAVWRPAGDRLDEMSALRLVQLTRHDPIPAHERWGQDIKILDRFGNIASVMKWRQEYQHMAKWNGQWVIVNVLWGMRPEEQGGVDDAAIISTALDYIEGWYEGDAVRMERSIHPELAKRIVRPCEPPDGDRLEEINAIRLVYATRHEPILAHQRRTDVTILHRFENAASVRVDAKDWVEYLHMARWNGEWTIVSILWEMRPEARTP
jgi:hypothetical protein